MRWLSLSVFLAVLVISTGCGSSKPADNDHESEAADCTEPSNPYTGGTGHYAGYEWAEKNGSGAATPLHSRSMRDVKNTRPKNQNTKRAKPRRDISLNPFSKNICFPNPQGPS